jgi:putative ABC transport system permease protein
VGFDREHVITAQMSMQGKPSQTAMTVPAFYEQLLERIRARPGVAAAAVASNIPIERGLNFPIEPAGSITQIRSIDWRYVTRDYFTVFRVPLQAGRLFGPIDATSGPPVALVNEAFANAYFGNAGASVGESIQLLRTLGDLPRRIVGVVGNTKGASAAGWASGHPLAAQATPTVFIPATQVPDTLFRIIHRAFPVTWVVRTRGSDSRVMPGLQQVMHEAAPTVPVIRFTTMTQVIAASTELQRVLRLLLGVLAGIALLLAAMGIYGLIAYTVARRTQEIGVRMALGASRARILRYFLHESLALAGLGAGVGIAFAVGFSRFLPAMMWGIRPPDPAIFAGVAVVLFLVASTAGLLPAMRAAAVDPTVALRCE